MDDVEKGKPFPFLSRFCLLLRFDIAFTDDNQQRCQEPGE